MGQESIKIGYVNVQRVVNSSSSGKLAKENFQAEVKKVESNLLKTKKELELLESDFKRKSLLLNEKEKKNLQRNLQKRIRDYQMTMRDKQEELREREREMTTAFLKTVHSIVVQLGKAENFSFIMQKEQFMYSNNSMDLTDKIIKLVDIQSKNRLNKK